MMTGRRRRRQCAAAGRLTVENAARILRRMMFPLRSFTIGAAVAGASLLVVRPLLVRTLAAGYTIKDRLALTVDEAKAEAQRIRADALASRVDSREHEVEALRREIAELKASKKKAS
jgi:hypothetical protein